MPVAVLVDGSFFLKRHRSLWGSKTPEEVAKDLHTMALRHVDYVKSGKTNTRNETSVTDLYRIFYYDAPPLGDDGERTQNPISKEHIAFNKTEEYFFRRNFLTELKKKRKIALRMGRLGVSGWKFRASETVKEICTGKKSSADLVQSDIEFSITQKGVDMRIGLDIATLAYKKLADTIVLIAGDSDFVPAAKLARREGVDFILDPMRSTNVTEDLFEHIDGLKSFTPGVNRKKVANKHKIKKTKSKKKAKSKKTSK